MVYQKVWVLKMEDKVHISVVTPVYGCASVLERLYKRLVDTLEKITDSFEIIMVNDKSPDNAWEVIEQLAMQDERVKGINLSRNFGQHFAITAGLDFVKGDWIVVMDCDLQDQPEEIAKLYKKAMEGYDVVFGKRTERKDGFFKKLGSKLFYIVYDYFTDTKNKSGTANFGIFSKKVIENYKRMREHNRTFPLFIRWIGFKTAEIDIEHAARPEGKSSYNLYRLFSLAFDSIVSQSNKPLRLSIGFGFIMSFLSMVYGIWQIIKYYMWGVPVEGWTSVIVSIYFIGGLLFANMGILGIYIGKIFNETKNRPLYIIDKTTWISEEEMYPRRDMTIQNRI